MDRRTRAALHSMLDDFLDRPPPPGMVAAFSLAVDDRGRVSLLAMLDVGGLARDVRAELELPTPEAAARAAGMFGDELDGLARFARAARVVGQVAGPRAGEAGRN